MSEIIHVKLPDGSVRDVPRGTSALDIAKSISPRLADAALAAQIKPLSSNGNGSGGNGHHPVANEPPDAAPASAHAPAAKDGSQLIDLARPLEQDAELRILTDRDP
ncbi:MAG: TGS domain-containing protein, partial [Candidatus Korobacteraceae bacterium]